ncbi:hypothetical protein S40288_09480 [Stachybotrys chartarum IBT 40288]|nr:hypothetical protein S40288_09480 [Stachybotrys chartarum IBT 40288]
MAHGEEDHRLCLLCLPYEILTKILEIPMTFPSSINLCPGFLSTHRPTTLLATTNRVAILLTHRTIRHIAEPLLYSNLNSFHLNVEGKHITHLRRVLVDTPEDLLATGLVRPLILNPRALRQIRVLTLRFESLHNRILEHISPLFMVKKNKGGLRKLCVVPKKLPDELESCRLLLKLLNSPDLLTSQLGIDRVHAAVWCEFHDKLTPCAQDQRGNHTHQELVEIDIRRLASACVTDESTDVTLPASVTATESYVMTPSLQSIVAQFTLRSLYGQTEDGFSSWTPTKDFMTMSLGDFETDIALKGLQANGKGFVFRVVCGKLKVQAVVHHGNDAEFGKLKSIITQLITAVSVQRHRDQDYGNQERLHIWVYVETRTLRGNHQWCIEEDPDPEFNISF